MTETTTARDDQHVQHGKPTRRKRIVLHPLVQAIKDRKEGLGWTNAKLARKSGLIASTLSMYWHGRCHPTVPQLAIMADAVGLRLDVVDPVEVTREAKATVNIDPEAVADAVVSRLAMRLTVSPAV